VANRRTGTVDVHEMIRLMRAGATDREIVKVIGRNRRTVSKFRKWAKEQGLMEGPMLDVPALQRLLSETMATQQPPQQTSSVVEYAKEIEDMRAQGMEMAAIRVRLEENHHRAVSYDAVRRFVGRLAPPEPEVFVRVEVAPGSEAQVDFGWAGYTFDPSGRRRKTWVFVMTLSYSRHMYAELVYDQTAATWLLCHRHAFEFFGGVPGRIVPDNLGSAIVKASFEDPVVQRSYRECAEHYGIMIDPNPPATPRLKGKVEKGGVHFVKRNFLAGREPELTSALNEKLLVWCTTVAADRVHGTTKARPRERFDALERSSLEALPVTPYDPGVWKKVKLHRDCYIQFECAYYSAPFRLVGQQVWARGGTRTVMIYTIDHEWVATHDRVGRGERQTTLDHLPPEKVPGLTLTRDNCRMRAEAVGPATLRLVEELLANRPVDKLRVAGRVVALAERHGAARLEKACARALVFEDTAYTTVRRILQQGLEDAPVAPSAATVEGSTPRLYRYARHAHELAAGLLGVGR